MTHSSSSKPKVSVITVNFNMADSIRGTLDSVLAQDYPHVESVVIDGASTDGSREIIASYGSRLGHWVSEPDRNLYDGMNKGVAAATGEWVLFMNSGDRFADADVLSRLFAAAPQNGTAVLYGHHKRRYAELGIERLVRAEAPKVLPYRMHCSHQSMAMRRQLLLERPFALDLLIADYDAILAAYVAGRRFEAVDCVVAVTTQGGRSDINRFRALRERAMLVRRGRLMTPRVALYYVYLVMRTAAALGLKRVLPGAIVSSILRYRPIKGMG